MDVHRPAGCPSKSSTRGEFPEIGSGSDRPQYIRWRSRFPAVAASVLMAALFGPGAARASTEIFNYNTTSGTVLTSQGSEVVGATYSTLSSPVTFNSLGFIDLPATPGSDYHSWFGSDGLVGTYQLGIWLTSTQTLLATTTVSPTSTLIGNFRYSSIAATTIPANTSFTIAALLPDSTSQDAWLMNTVGINTPDFSGSGLGRTLSSSTLAFPTVADSNGYTYAAVNASTAVVAPEPASTACLVLGLGCLGLFRYRRVARARA